MCRRLGISFIIVPSNSSLDAAYIIPAANGFPDLPAGQDQSGTKKLAMDCEGLVYNCDGSFYISDEYGRMPNPQWVLTLAYIYHFNPQGILIDVIVPPEAFIPMRNGTESFSANSPPIFAPNAVAKPANPTTGRQNNQGFEGLTISPDGKTLYVLLQSSLIQDGGTSTTRENTRFLRWDIEGKKWTGEWVVVLPFFNDNGARHIAAQSECHYLTDERFFVLARDSNRGYGFPNSTSVYRHVYRFLRNKTDFRSTFSISRKRQISSAPSMTTDHTLLRPMEPSFPTSHPLNITHLSISISILSSPSLVSSTEALEMGRDC